jgi:hypothetical protein
VTSTACATGYGNVRKSFKMSDRPHIDNADRGSEGAHESAAVQLLLVADGLQLYALNDTPPVLAGA